MRLKRNGEKAINRRFKPPPDSPTCIPELNDQFGLAIAADLMDAAEKKWRKSHQQAI